MWFLWEKQTLLFVFLSQVCQINSTLHPNTWLDNVLSGRRSQVGSLLVLEVKNTKSIAKYCMGKGSPDKHKALDIYLIFNFARIFNS